MKEPMFLKPVLQEKIWGGTKLEEFGYDLPSDHVGECWAISAHSNGPSTVKNGPFEGMTLDEVWNQHREVFGNSKGEVFPLLTKIIDANKDLSVQVHPDDTYAMKHERELGKTECWYIIDADEGAEIVYGHHAKTKEELQQMIESEDWEHLLRRVKVKKGDFYFVPSGTIHAIGAGIMVLETQQSSDTTYRVYDYDRKGDDGQARDLHIQQSIDVTTVPFNEPKTKSQLEKEKNLDITTLVKSDFFNVYKWEIHGVATFTTSAPYTLVSVIEGEGNLIIDSEREHQIKKGTHFILPSDVTSWSINGNLDIIASTPGKELTE